jgi:hypothetical protein
MVNFEDAKKQVQSLYGEIQGYSYLNWTPNIARDNGQLNIDNSYVFVGRIYIVTPPTYLNYAVINMYQDQQIEIIVNANITNSSSTYVDFIGMDKGPNPLVDTARSTWVRGIIVIGWLFQINK